MMDDIKLEPNYPTGEIAGKCIKCLAEQEYGHCLRELLKEGEQKEALEGRYEAVVSFLESPELKKLRDESEKYLSEGKQVTVKIHLEAGKPRYELEIE
ncbi:hypothetical protein ACFLX5_03495 [Chloroflexota bacterium]